MSDRLSDEALADLLAKAEAARDEPMRVSAGTVLGGRVPVVTPEGAVLATFRERSNAEHYAAANPATVTALVREVQAVRRVLAPVAEEVRQADAVHFLPDWVVLPLRRSMADWRALAALGDGATAVPPAPPAAPAPRTPGRSD